jgi:hypothetical protein
MEAQWSAPAAVHANALFRLFDALDEPALRLPRAGGCKNRKARASGMINDVSAHVVPQSAL